MEALVTAAKAEGALNVTALPRDWADSGAIMDGFTRRYGIRVRDDDPGGASQDELNAITSRRGRTDAPDVVDIGSSFAAGGVRQGLFASQAAAELPPVSGEPAFPTDEQLENAKTTVAEKWVRVLS